MTTPRIIGLLSFYDENPQWLRDAITTFARCGVTHFIAVDGAYFLLQDGKPASPRKQHKAIIDTCANQQLGLTLHVPETVWYENEVEKRTFMFQLADTISQPGDWVCIIDADETVEHTVDLRRELAGVEEDVAEVQIVERYSQDDPVMKAHPTMPLETKQKIRKLFRARGLHCAGNHFTYRDDQGRTLWGHAQTGLTPSFDVPMMRVWHRSRDRNITRHRQQYAYYQRRDNLQVEATHGDKCAFCDNPATQTVDGNLEPDPTGRYAQSDRIPTCEKHAQRVRWNNAADYLYGNPHGLTADQVVAANEQAGIDRFIPR